MMQNLKPLKWVMPIFLGLSLVGPQPALAGPSFSLTPARMSFEPLGSGATRSFRVISTGDEPTAIEIHMTTRQMDLDGTETHLDAEDDFLIYPPQILLRPGEAQTVRVTWVGDPEPTSELAYRIIAEQLPINLNEARHQSGDRNVNLTILFRYVGAVYITPEDVAPNVVLESTEHRTAGEADELVLVFNNQGTSHQLLREPNVQLTPLGSDGQPRSEAAVNLEPDQLQGISGENVLAGHQRRFIIPWPEELPVGPVEATFEFEQN